VVKLFVLCGAAGAAVVLSRGRLHQRRQEISAAATHDSLGGRVHISRLISVQFSSVQNEMSPAIGVCDVLIV